MRIRSSSERSERWSAGPLVRLRFGEGICSSMLPERLLFEGIAAMGLLLKIKDILKFVATINASYRKRRAATLLIATEVSCFKYTTDSGLLASRIQLWNL